MRRRCLVSFSASFASLIFAADIVYEGTTHENDPPRYRGEVVFIISQSWLPLRLQLSSRPRESRISASLRAPPAQPASPSLFLAAGSPRPLHRLFECKTAVCNRRKTACAVRPLLW